jgi:tetratricopeptide (TPR) repeat protein
MKNSSLAMKTLYHSFLLLVALFFITNEPLCWGAVDTSLNHEGLVDEASFSELYNQINSLKRTRPQDAIELAVSYINNPEQLTEDQRYSLLFMTGEAFAALDLSLTAIDAFTSSINYGTEHLPAGKLASWLMELGNLYFKERNFEKADSVYVQSYKLYSQGSDSLSNLGMATALNNRALVKAEFNQIDEAEELLNQALVYRMQSSNPNHIAFNYISLAELYLEHTTRFEEAKKYLIKADSILSDSLNDRYLPLYQGLINEYLGDYFVIKNDQDQFLFFYREALEAYQETETRLEIRVLLKIYNQYSERGDEQNAWMYLEKAFELAKQHGSFLEQRRVLETKVQWYKAKNDAENSLKYAEEIVRLIDQNNALEREIALKVGQLNRQVAQLDINLLKERNEKISAEFNKNTAILALIVFFIAGFIWFLKVQAEKRDAKIIQNQKEELFEKALESERWKSLRLQLKPHFLYNVLSSLRALIQIDSNAAVKMTEHLAKYFRQILDAEQTETVNLTSEIALCREYLALQSIRFNNELAYSFEIDETLNNFKIPSMLLFPLVENAVKYGYKTNPRDMHVKVHISKTDEYIRFAIMNKGSWIEPRIDYQNDLYEGGLGFRNSKSRLMHHYGNDWSLNQNEAEGFVTIEVLIRLDKLNLLPS